MWYVMAEVPEGSPASPDHFAGVGKTKREAIMDFIGRWFDRTQLENKHKHYSFGIYEEINFNHVTEEQRIWHLSNVEGCSVCTPVLKLTEEEVGHVPS